MALAMLAGGATAAMLPQLGCSRRLSGGMSAETVAQMSLRDAARGLREGSFSSVALTRACLARIDRYNARINGFVTITREQALAAAADADHEIAAGRWRGPLHGIPIGLKDNIDTAGIRTTAASAVFADRIPGEDAKVVQRLKSAGAVILGKLNMHEFGIGATSAISHYGPVRNPWNPERIAGGSSGGSAAAVAAGFCFGALGTDTGGSIRIPAACCGVVGLKPTFGAVSTSGVVPMSTSFDHVGPLCRSVADTVLLFQEMKETPLAPEYDPEIPPATSRLRIGILAARPPLCDTAPDADVQSAFEASVDVIRHFGANVGDAELPMPDLTALIDIEAYAFHERYLAEMPDRYDPRTREALFVGRGASPEHVARLREDIADFRATIHTAFDRFDLMVVPTLTEPAAVLAQTTDPFGQNACTTAFNVGGLPSMSVPCGFSRSGLPLGLLISGPPGAEANLFALAQAYESATAWHTKRPPM